MYKPIISGKFGELCTTKLWAVVTPQLIWYAIPRKLALEVTDGVLAGKIVQFVNFNPLGIVIDSQQVGCTVVLKEICSNFGPWSVLCF